MSCEGARFAYTKESTDNNEKKIHSISKMLLQRTAEVLRHWDDQKGQRAPLEGAQKTIQTNIAKPEDVVQQYPPTGGGRENSRVLADNPADVLLRNISVHMKKLQTRAYDMFREIDKDGTGSLDEDEFRSALNGLGLALSPEDWKLILNIADSNGDGQLSYREFEAAVRGFRRRELLKKKYGDKAADTSKSGPYEHFSRKDNTSLREVREQLREVEEQPFVGQRSSTSGSLVQREIEKRWSKRSERKLNVNLVQMNRQKKFQEEEQKWAKALEAQKKNRTFALETLRNRSRRSARRKTTSDNRISCELPNNVSEPVTKGTKRKRRCCNRRKNSTTSRTESAN